MTKRDIIIPVDELTEEELTAAERELVEAARKATQTSYAPYSRFHVGAAIRLSDGAVVSGSNQENVAFPSGICAERTACYYAGASHPDATFEMIAIAARDSKGEPTAEPIAPCGACRQALLEYELRAGHDVPLLLAGRDTILRLPSVRSTLPVTFTEF